ncbi:MAG: hypothetical protein QM504_01080 [Pseudomonadota bacterium]
MANKSEPVLVKLNTDKISIECHPSALRAWQCWRNLNRQFSPQNLSPEAIKLLQDLEPLHVVGNLHNEKYSFFSGFSSAVFINNTSVKKATFCVHKRLLQEEIERLAWASVLKTMLFDLDRKVGLGSMHDVINQHMPAGLCREFFGRKILSQPRLAELSGVPVSALRWQAKQRKTPNNSNESILSRILKK